MKIVISIFLILVLMLSLNLEVTENAMLLNDAAFDRAMVAFGIAKGLNALISLIQGTSLSVTPVGVGMSFSVGEVLDPFNDMLERFSWVMLLATVSLGIQKFILLLSTKLFLQIAFTISIFLSLSFIWIKKIKNDRMFSLSLKFFLIMLLLRFSAVLFINISSLLYNSMLQDQYIEANIVLSETKVHVKEFQNSNLAFEPKSNIVEKIASTYKSTIGALNISKKLEVLEKYIDEASQNIIKLITIFILQSILIPIFYAFMLFSSIKYIVNLRTLTCVLK